MNEKMLQLLYESFDRKLASAEEQELNNALAASAELRQEQQRISALRQHLAEVNVQNFKPFFATRVMSRITALREKDLFYQDLFYVFRRIAAVTVLLLIFLVGYNLIRHGEVSMSAALALNNSEIALAEFYEPDYSGILEVNQ